MKCSIIIITWRIVLHNKRMLAGNRLDDGNLIAITDTKVIEYVDKPYCICHLITKSTFKGSHWNTTERDNQNIIINKAKAYFD